METNLYCSTIDRDRPKEVGPLALWNRTWHEEERAKAGFEWQRRGSRLEPDAGSLWFLWNRAECCSPAEMAAAADHAATLILSKDGYFETLVQALVGDGWQEEGEAIDLDLSEGNDEQLVLARPTLIWTMRGLARAARLAEASGSTLVTLFEPAGV